MIKAIVVFAFLVLIFLFLGRRKSGGQYEYECPTQEKESADHDFHLRARRAYLIIIIIQRTLQTRPGKWRVIAHFRVSPPASVVSSGQKRAKQFAKNAKLGFSQLRRNRCRIGHKCIFPSENTTGGFLRWSPLCRSLCSSLYWPSSA